MLQILCLVNILIHYKISITFNCPTYFICMLPTGKLVRIFINISLFTYPANKVANLLQYKLQNYFPRFSFYYGLNSGYIPVLDPHLLFTHYQCFCIHYPYSTGMRTISVDYWLDKASVSLKDPGSVPPCNVNLANELL